MRKWWITHLGFGRNKSDTGGRQITGRAGL